MARDSDAAEILTQPWRVAEAAVVLFLTFEENPMPCPRPRVGESGTVNRPEYRAYKGRLKAAMAEAVAGRDEEAPRPAFFGLKAFFYRGNAIRCDLDNMCKTICDAGTGILWGDDSQVVEIYGRMRLDREQPRTVILAYALEVEAVAEKVKVKAPARPAERPWRVNGAMWERDGNGVCTHDGCGGLVAFFRAGTDLRAECRKCGRDWYRRSSEEPWQPCPRLPKGAVLG